MRYLHPLAALLLTACSSAADAADAPNPAGGAADASTDDAGGDSSASTDASHPHDGAPSSDASPSLDAMGDSAAGDAAACVPSAGTTSATSECDQIQLAVLRNGAATPTVVIQGRLNLESITTSACTAVDTVDVLSNGATIATISGAPSTSPTGGETDRLANGPSTAPLTALCASDTGRFDGVGIVVHGHIDGGTFTATCGAGAQGSEWPPSVVLTCHSGIDSIPLGTDAVDMSQQIMGMTVSYDQLYALIAQPPMLTSLDSTVHFIAGTSPFGGGAPIAPVDTTGWMGDTSTMQLSGGGSGTNLSLMHDPDILGAQICPPSCAAPPCATTPPVFIARVTGAADTGAFESELYFDLCSNAP